jgi:hypothetical protein
VEEEIKGEFIGFRVTREDVEMVREKAQLSGRRVADWCRDVVLSEARKEVGMTASERAIFEQVTVVRHLFGRYLRRTLPHEEYQKLRSEVEHNQAKIADLFLARLSNKGKK